MNKEEKTGFMIFCIILALLIIMLPYKMFLFNESYYHSQFRKLDVYSSVGEGKAKETLNEIFSFLKEKQDKIENFNKNELSHMRDVRNLLYKLDILFYVLIFLFALFLLLWSFYYRTEETKEKYKCLFLSFFYSGTICIIIFTTAGLLIVIDFNLAFTLFHKIFFPMGNYTFDPSVSLLKQLFPNKFFYNFSILCAIISILFSVILIALSFVYNRWSIFAKTKE
ncbi:DUF1461 domain-containing protein [Candidatus Woesearchaeota archaeon]|nr:DUF1461 domain-containing protein [Candidatus Woesearchaeota archaeon]